jgi:CheY-like chemotaxis protein
MSNKAAMIADRQAFENWLKSATVLIVDDISAMRKITANQLREMGVPKIVEAANGLEALKQLSLAPVSLILSDWNMPVMSGLDLLLSVRGNPDFFAIPFVMITADAERQRIVQAAHAGVSGLLVKPYSGAKLAERIERAFARRPRTDAPLDPEATRAAPVLTAQAASAPARPDFPTLTRRVAATAPAAAERAEPERPQILVVDDVADNLMLLSELFEGEYGVRIANSGKKALTICQSETPPDLILLDVMMPGMDGFEVACALRSHPASEHIPIVFITALSDESSRLKGMALGAVDFVTKPIDPELLKVRVGNFMRYVRLHKNLQADYDSILETARLQEQVEQLARHDIKGPLAAVLGLAQGLGDADGLSDDQRQQVRMMEEAAQTALATINRSADLYKIEAGTFEFIPQRASLARILRRLVEQARRSFAAKELIIALGTPHGVDDGELCALIDPSLCYSALENLIKNACEAAPSVSTVTVSIRKETPIRVSIENSGVVPRPIRSTFFDKFVTHGKRGGTGLGTYSAKLLIETQGGSIAMATDDRNDKTTITVTLPACA